MTVFRFIERERANHPVATMCRVLGVSTSGYYGWRKRGPSTRVQEDLKLMGPIRDIHHHSRGTSRPRGTAVGLGPSLFQETGRQAHGPDGADGSPPRAASRHHPS